MIRLEIKTYGMILTENKKKYQHDHLVELIKINILQLKKY